MINAIRITNFQGHRKLRIKFDKGVTTIIGPSDAGKSAIIRALAWVCFNRPRGDAFIHDEAEFANVSLFVDGYRITRKRGKVNEYALQASREEDGQFYRAFGNDVPADIEDLLKVNALNFQAQHDSPFWFCETPGQVSRELNQIINLGVIDDALSNVLARQRKQKAEVEILSELARSNAIIVKNLDKFKKCDVQLKRIEDLSVQITVNRSRASSLKTLLDNVSQHRQTLKRTKDMRIGARNCVKLGKKLIEHNKRRKALNELLLEMSLARSIITIRKQANFDHVEKLHDEVHKCNIKITKLGLLLDKFKQAQATSVSASISKGLARMKLNTALKGKCPLCGTKKKLLP